MKGKNCTGLIRDRDCTSEKRNAKISTPMHRQSHHNKIPSVLSFYPNTRGIGYSFFQSNKEHFVSEMITTRNRFSNEKYLQRMKQKIENFNPQIIVLPEYRKNKGSVKSERIRVLIKQIANYAKRQGIPIHFHTRHRIREVFSIYNVMTKYDIAKLICSWIPSLESQMYKPRSGQRMEPYSSAVFESISLAITYFYLNE